MTDGSPYPPDLQALAAEVLALARAQGVRIVTAESCTGGLVAGALTEVAGSSDVVEGGLVTYSNALKQRLLGVPGETLRAHGAVSEAVARAMAEGAAARLEAELSVSVTGVAGPGGGTEAKPVGLVWFGSQRVGRPAVTREHRFGDLGRSAVRLESVRAALLLLREQLQADGGEP